MPEAIRVCVVGLGAIGREVWKALADRPGVRAVAAADPAFAGRDASELAGAGAAGVVVRGSLEEAVATPADVTVLLTSSGVADVAPALRAAIAAGQNVVSTCEDLALPDLSAPDLAAEIDRLARRHDVTVLGTGVNPGFVMDRLPLVLAGACVRVRSVHVGRVVDAAKRRGPLRAKVGAGMTEAEFRAGVAARRLGHRGLPESCALLGRGLGVRFDQIRSTIEPVFTAAAAPRDGVDPSRVAGLRQSAVGLRAGREIVRLDLEMSVAAPDPHDRIAIDGDPPLDVVIRGGTHGDRGTVGTVVNAIPAVVAAPPGLLRVTDLPLYGCLFEG